MYEMILALMAFAGLFILVRFVRGETAPDRVIAGDSLITIVVAVMAVLSLVYGSEFLIDIAIVYTILAFLGTLAISKYLEKGGRWE